VDRECKNNAFENQFKPFYTKPEVLRARAVFNFFGDFQVRPRAVWSDFDFRGY